MSQGHRPRIVIIGGGMAGLVTAWELTSGEWRQRYRSVRVLQRGWRLGGKGASSRGRHGRIEEHGLHVLLGYYRDTFRVMQECYAELNRPATAPDCPIQTWDDAVTPVSSVGLTDHDDQLGWLPWQMEFPRFPTGPPEAAGSAAVIAVVTRALQMLAAFYAANRRVPVISISGDSTPPWKAAPSDVLRGIGLTALAGILEAIQATEEALPRMAGEQLGATLASTLRPLREAIEHTLAESASGSRTAALVDLALTNLVGIVADGLLWRPDGLRAIDDLDYRMWLQRHGARPETVDSTVVRAMYDLVFAYRDGDAEQPAFAAGWGLELAALMLFTYEGSLFWKMQAGMGEVIFAPLFEALRVRGVEFDFFHRVDELLAADGALTTIRGARQVEVLSPPYQPLIDSRGLPAWPAAPDSAQLGESGDWLQGSESFFGERRDVATFELAAGGDFDVAVFAGSLGIVPYVCSDLVGKDPRWRAMVDNVATVATQAFQLWLTDDEPALGWPQDAGVTLSGFADPFDTWASMSHLVPVEDWPDAAGVRAIAYFCGSMGEEEPGVARDAVRARAVRFLDEEVGSIWPQAVTDAGFRWELLADSEATGSERLAAQYWRANIDPSDRYVQSLPGSDRYRLAPGESGFANLVIAGDWTDCGLNAGCIEAATRSGILAAAAVASRTDNVPER